MKIIIDILIGLVLVLICATCSVFVTLVLHSFHENGCNIGGHIFTAILIACTIGAAYLLGENT